MSLSIQFLFALVALIISERIEGAAASRPRKNRGWFCRKLLLHKQERKRVGGVPKMTTVCAPLLPYCQFQISVIIEKSYVNRAVVLDPLMKT